MIVRIQLYPGSHLKEFGIGQALRRIPVGAGFSAQQIGGQAVRNTELGVAAAGVSVPAELIPLIVGGRHEDLFNILRLKAVSCHQGVQTVDGRLNPHVCGPVLEQELAKQVLGSQIAVDPAFICKSAHHHGIAGLPVHDIINIVQLVPLRHPRHHSSGQAGNCILQMIEVGALQGQNSVHHRSGAACSAQQQVILIRITSVKFTRRGCAGEYLPGSKSPSIFSGIKFRRGLDIAGDALVYFKAADHRSEIILAGTVHGFGHGHGNGDEMGAGVARIAAIFPVQRVRGRGVSHNRAVHWQFSRLAPHGRHQVRLGPNRSPGG